MKGTILLSHGDGGALTQGLIEEIFLRQFNGGKKSPPADAYIFKTAPGRAALTTDSFVINPLFFPGGDIGKLAVCGTVNDLAVSGAVPLYLTAAFIIEEGFPLKKLARIAASMARTARQAGVVIAAGDTKVVGRGQADGLFITTTGYGAVDNAVDTGLHRIKPGDQILINGGIGEHGLAVLAERERLQLTGRLQSDCAPLNGIIGDLLDRCGVGVKFMRDLTRGGLATALKEAAAGSGTEMRLDEPGIPVKPPVRGLAEMLGLDPLYLANEGKFIAVVAPGSAGQALKCLKNHPLGINAAVIGRITPGAGALLLKTALGGTKNLELFAGAPLPRIC